MSRFVQKGFVITFATFTIILIIMLSYSVYVYFGVCKATRMLVCDMAFTVSEDDTSIKTILTIQNPSEFNFLVVYVSEKFYLYGTIVGKYDGYWNRSSENPLELHSFSSLDVIVNAKDVCSKEQMEDLHAVVTIGIETPLPDRIPLRFAEAFHDDA